MSLTKLFVPHRTAGGLVVTAIAALLTPGAGYAGDTPIAALYDLSIEQLSNIEITSVSKRPERLADAAASVFVITQNDIRRSGATTLPETLRLAPNLQVAAVGSYGYAISARGFNFVAANKLLVLIDGRSVYTPFASGVFWDMQEVMLEDVERIEVISGAGGTLWGTNAVNGVINVITRSAKDTRGELATSGVGQIGSEVSLRHGASSGADGAFRVYGKYVARGHSDTVSGAPVDDASHKEWAGFRADWGEAGDQIGVQGHAYRGAEGQPRPAPFGISGTFALGAISLSGINLLGRWQRVAEDGSNLNVQAYFDRTERTVSPIYAETLDIVDLQLQYALPSTGMHRFVGGAGYRFGMDRVTNSQYVNFQPANVDQRWPTLFAQDEMTLREHLLLTVGARIERNDYTGSEFLPQARLAWKPAPDHLLWSAVSRAVRAPSRVDRDVYVPGTAPFPILGGPNLRSEIADDVEIGYRGQPQPGFSYSTTLFYSRYDRLRSQEVSADGKYAFFGNGVEGRTSGIEMWGTFQVSPNWRLHGGWWAQRETQRLKADSTARKDIFFGDRDPAHTWTLRSAFDVRKDSELDVSVRRVAALANPPVPGYSAVDARFGWRPCKDLELSLSGRNLSGGHAEFASAATRAEFKRQVFFKLLWRM